MKNCIIYNHPITNNYTFNDLIKELNHIYNNTIKLEEELESVLLNLNYDKDIISEFISYLNVSYNLKSIIDLLTDFL